MSGERFRITYVLTCGPGEDAKTTAEEIALEQTVELPSGCISAELRERVVGSVERIEALEEGRWRAVISYPVEAVGAEIPQFLNLLFGNISLKRGILVKQVDWAKRWLSRFPGPRFGIDGLRRLCGVARRRPLLCAALKPMGLSAIELAQICGSFARGGVDLVKDDHGLADQDSAPFDERLERCQEALARVNAETGGTTLYVPNVTGDAASLESRLEQARRAGCRGVLLSPLLVGPDTVRHVAESSGLAVLAHPAMSGAYFGDDHGIAAELLLGDIFRIIGCDGVIYPNVGGRFPFSARVCAAINARLQGPLGSMRPAFPVPGGGIDVERVPYWFDRYGLDVIFLIGGGLYAQADLAGASAALSRAIKARTP
jgi:ribulose-bisphosphate carboxylase large chain